MCIPSDHKPTDQDWLSVMEALSTMKPTVQQRSRRRVRFSSTVSAVKSDKAVEEVADLWYKQNDLTIFRRVAKKEVLDSSDRGLEYCKQKQRRLAVKCVLQATRRMDERNVSVVSKKCSEWSCELAFLKACHDYCECYEPGMKCTLPQLSSIPPRFPYATKKREATSCCGIGCAQQSERRVRRRIMGTA